jgi:hypothetical protein
MFLSLDWRAVDHVFFLPQFKGNSWCLMVPAMEGQKGVAPSSNYWKEITDDHKIIIKIF